MKKLFISFIFLILCQAQNASLCFSKGTIEVDLGKKELRLIDFSLPDFKAEGVIDLEEGDIAIGINASWFQESKVLDGQVDLYVKVWGKVDDFFVSGHVLLKNGRYKARDFSELRLDFLGKLPVLNITDSRLIFKNGSISSIEGVLNLADFSNLVPGAKLNVSKLSFDQWQVFAENRNIVLKKNLDDRFDVFVNANKKEDETTHPETEIRYNLKGDKLLKFKWQDDQSILGFEKRMSF